jgi:HlyD family secretion protein
MNPDVATLGTSAPAGPKASVRRWWWGAAVVILIGAGIAVWTIGFGGRPKLNGDSPRHSSDSTSYSSGPTKVDVVAPKPGGIPRLCVQPGTLEPFESAELYAKVSGFLIETVDIDKEVHRGDVLARISVPEYEKQVAKDKALVANADAKVKQMDAQLTASTSEAKAAKQMIVLAKIVMKSKGVYRSYRLKQLERIKALYADNAVDAKLVDESMDHYEAALEAENAAAEAITTNELKWDAANAKVAQSQADLEEAKSAVNVAKAELERAQVLLGYTVITSPYDGVVTKRNFFRGDSIRAFDAGGTGIPIVAVDRTDLMRCVVQVPNSDVPYVDIGDEAEITFDAMPGRVFSAKVARSARALDAQTRTMRTEIDLPNDHKQFVRNMYAHVVIRLSDGLPSTMRIPSAAIIGKDKDGVGARVRIVENHRLHIARVKTGMDNGSEVEIIKGLEPSDRVVLHASGPVEEGTEVEIADDSTAESRH